MHTQFKPALDLTFVNTTMIACRYCHSDLHKLLHGGDLVYPTVEKLPWSLKLKLMREVAVGMAYIHSESTTLHLDLKPVSHVQTLSLPSLLVYVYCPAHITLTLPACIRT